MIDLFSKLSNAEERVMRTGSATLVTAQKTYLERVEHRRFVNYEKQFSCFQYALPFFVKVYVKQVISQKLDTVGSEELVEKRNVCVKKTAASARRIEVDSWTMSSGFVPCGHFRCIQGFFIGIGRGMQHFLTHSGT